MGDTDTAQIVREGTAAPRGTSHMKCLFPAGSGIPPPACQEDGNPGLEGAKIKLGKQIESRLVPVPPRPLAG